MKGENQMSSSIITAPAANPQAQINYTNTVETLVLVQDILNSVSPADSIRLSKTFKGLTHVAVWGSRGGFTRNINGWNRINQGDIVLFGGKVNDIAGRIFSTGIILDKVHSPILAKKLWNSNTWEYIFFLDNIQACDESFYDTYNPIMNDKRPWIQYFNAVETNQEQHNEFLNKFYANVTNVKFNTELAMILTLLTEATQRLNVLTNQPLTLPLHKPLAPLSLT